MTRLERPAVATSTAAAVGVTAGEVGVDMRGEVEVGTEEGTTRDRDKVVMADHKEGTAVAGGAGSEGAMASHSDKGSRSYDRDDGL